MSGVPIQFPAFLTDAWQPNCTPAMSGQYYSTEESSPVDWPDERTDELVGWENGVDESIDW